MNTTTTYATGNGLPDEVRAELIDALVATGNETTVAIVESGLRPWREGDRVGSTAWIVARNGILTLLNEYVPRWTSATGSSVITPVNIVSRLRNVPMSETARERVDGFFDFIEEVTIDTDVDVDDYDAAMDAAGSVIYAWRWSNSSNVKIGKTTRGTRRWGNDDRRPTDEDPDAWAEHIARRGYRVDIGFVPVLEDSLSEAEAFAHRLKAEVRRGGEFFAISDESAADVLTAVGYKAGSTPVFA